MPKHKWQCPICSQPLPLGSLFVDPYFDEILLHTEKSCATEVEVMKDGVWKAIQVDFPFLLSLT